MAQLSRCRLIEPSYIPTPEMVQLSLLTRACVLTSNVKLKLKMKFTISYKGPISS